MVGLALCALIGFVMWMVFLYGIGAIVSIVSYVFRGFK